MARCRFTLVVPKQLIASLSHHFKAKTTKTSSFFQQPILNAPSSSTDCFYQETPNHHERGVSLRRRIQ